jgi:hypothetical protein
MTLEVRVLGDKYPQYIGDERLIHNSLGVFLKTAHVAVRASGFVLQRNCA